MWTSQGCGPSTRITLSASAVTEERSEFITRAGRPVARLVPEPGQQDTDVRSVIAQIREFRKGRGFGDEITIRELVEEGQ